MRLSQILAELDHIEVRGTADPEICGLAYDSREVSAGDLYFAVVGEKHDGREFIAEAVGRGAAAVVSEGIFETGDAAVPAVLVKRTRKALGQVAAGFYGHPSREMAVVGITGTNGKTTSAWILHHLMKDNLHRVGLLGTVLYDDGVETSPAGRTTPESSDVHAMLRRMRDNGCGGVVMEVSSHALVQDRIEALEFDAGVFTNLTRDHLDYHRSMEDYYRAKSLLPKHLLHQGGGKKPVMLVNGDDIHGQRMVMDFSGRLPTVSYGFGSRCDLRAMGVQTGFRGTTFKLLVGGREILVTFPLIGRFNVYNALVALGVARVLGFNLRQCVRALGSCPQVPGRLESAVDNRPYRVFVDYAHTPDALENVLSTLRGLDPARIITVFGCGGDRDRSKRPMMGRIAARWSDVCIVTSDNPRSEDPVAILREIAAGISGRHYKLVEDRREAIALALQSAGERDIVLIAGKGHEDYQEIHGERFPFSDSEEARKAEEKRDHASKGGWQQ